METLYFDPKEITLPKPCPDAVRFGPTDKDGNGLLRTSIDPENFDGGLSIVDGRFNHNVDLRKGSGSVCPYRSEFTDWPWLIALPIGMYEYFAWEYCMTTPINMASPVSIFQGYAKMNGNDVMGVTTQLEMAGKNQLSGDRKIGQIQVVSPTALDSAGKGKRIWSDFIVEENVPFVIEMERMNALKEDGGFWKVTINKKVIYEENESTVYAGLPCGGQPKWGIYHHYLRTNATEWLKPNLDNGHQQCNLTTGPITVVRFAPGEKRPSYVRSLADPVRPSLTDGSSGAGGGNYDEGFAAGVKQEVDSLTGYANSR